MLKQNDDDYDDENEQVLYSRLKCFEHSKLQASYTTRANEEHKKMA